MRIADDPAIEPMDLLVARAVAKVAARNIPERITALHDVHMPCPRTPMLPRTIAAPYDPIMLPCITRGVAADIVEREFVQFAEALSVPRWRILWREVLPNITTPLLVEFGIRIVWSIAGIAALSIMGYGIQPPEADWGLMINENRGRIATRPLPVLAPGLCIAIFAFGINMIAEGIAGTVSGTSRKSGGEA